MYLDKFHYHLDFILFSLVDINFNRYWCYCNYCAAMLFDFNFFHTSQISHKTLTKQAKQHFFQR